MANLSNQCKFWMSAILLLMPLGVLASDAVINTSDGVAIHGYDPVAYFDKGMPAHGKRDLKYRWKGATWLFSSKKNRDAFMENPKSYEPQFGGFCAYAASYGQFADIDPNAWSIINGRLYLNFSPRVREIWRPRAKEFIGDAEQLWPNMVREKSAGVE